MRRGAPARRPVAAPPGAPGQNPTPEQTAVRAWVRVLAVHKHGLSAIRADIEREMTLPRFDLLSNLVREDGQTLAAISRSMLVTAGNITGLVDRAARDGLVERRADPKDRRAWRVHILPKGQRAFQEAERRHATKVARVFAGLSMDEVTTLIALLDKVKATLRTNDPDRPVQRRALPPRSKPVRPTRRITAAKVAPEPKKKRTP